MKKYSFSFVLVIVMLHFSSCSNLIYISKTHDPEITPGKKTGSIVFINQFDYTLPAMVKDKNEISYHAGVRNLTEGLISSSSQDKGFNFFSGDTLKKGTRAGLLTTLLPADSIISICNRFKADMLLALDSMNIFFDWETITDNDYNGKSKTKNFYIYTRFYLSLYSTTGNLIDRSQVQNSMLYKSRPTLSGLITVQPSIAKASNAVGSLSFKAGEDYADKFYPQTLKEPRSIYFGKAFRESNSYMHDGSWDNAIKILEQLVNSPDPKIAKRAQQNLSVAREAAGLNGN